jgi:predicted AAA+ superfamily ATPase
LEDERTRQRELQALTEVKDELKAVRLLVITDDEESTVPVELLRAQGEINIIPLWKWLLQFPQISQIKYLTQRRPG